MPLLPAPLRRIRKLALLAALLAALQPAAADAALPPVVNRALKAAGIPANAVSVYVQAVDLPKPLVVHYDKTPRNPASTMKLVTTYTALNLLGPDYAWLTLAATDGKLEQGTLHGNLYLVGAGDPKLTWEQLQKLVEQLRSRGIETINGDLVLDHSLFELPAHDPAAFDAAPERAYNVGPDALLVNFKAIRISLAPDPALNQVSVVTEPPQAYVTVANTPKPVPGDCGDWKTAAAPALANNASSVVVSFTGSYPLSCGTKDWWLGVMDHGPFAAGVFRALWAQSGGTLTGRDRDGVTPPDRQPLASVTSFPLAEQVRDINKWSNNVMARQLLLTLGTLQGRPATPAKGAATIRHWLARQGLGFRELVIENGSGLSREERISARSLTTLLRHAAANPVFPSFYDSLSIAGIDGTLRNRLAASPVAGRAYLKTGTLEGVKALSGYVDARDGRRFALTAIVNHPNAAHAGPALDALVEWVWAR